MIWVIGAALQRLTRPRNRRFGPEPREGLVERFVGECRLGRDELHVVELGATEVDDGGIEDTFGVLATGVNAPR